MVILVLHIVSYALYKGGGGLCIVYISRRLCYSEVKGEHIQDMVVENIKISDVIPYDKNAKKHDKTQIENVAESIK